MCVEDGRSNLQMKQSKPEKGARSNLKYQIPVCGQLPLNYGPTVVYSEVFWDAHLDGWFDPYRLYEGDPRLGFLSSMECGTQSRDVGRPARYLHVFHHDPACFLDFHMSRGSLRVFVAMGFQKRNWEKCHCQGNKINMVSVCYLRENPARRGAWYLHFFCFWSTHGLSLSGRLFGGQIFLRTLTSIGYSTAPYKPSTYIV